MNTDTADKPDPHESSDLVLVNEVAHIALRDKSLRPMLHAIVRAIKRHLRCEFVACATVDIGGHTYFCEALETDLPGLMHVDESGELGGSVLGEAVATGCSVLVADTNQRSNCIGNMSCTRSELCVPVLQNGEVIAVIDAQSARLDAFAGQQLLLETVAAQAAGAISAARMNLELRKRIDLLQMMSELLREAIDAGSLDAALQRISDYVHERFHLELCAVMLVNETGDQLWLKAETGISVLIEDSMPQWPTRMGINGRAFRTGEAQFVPNVGLDTDYVMGNPAVRCEYVVPIRFRRRLLGLIDMESASLDSFTDENRNMLDALAAQVAGAIHLTATNQRLSEFNREVAEQSEALERANMQLREANESLRRLSFLDGLTGVANRRRFDQALRSAWRRARREQSELSLLLLDIDDFKGYNDGYGHLAGDDCLRRIAAALNAAVTRPGDQLARYGGEEFSVLLPATGAAQAQHIAQALHKAVGDLEIPHRFARAGTHVTISVGVAVWSPEMRIVPSDFVRRADRALYAAKAEGRDRVVLAAGALRAKAHADSALFAADEL
ncbi:MAG TPA: diguanylate cyclase [Rudaea sp.]|nr:diguanylate cyclase [Rudaea sp.]